MTIKYFKCEDTYITEKRKEKKEKKTRIKYIG